MLIKSPMSQIAVLLLLILAVPLVAVYVPSVVGSLSPLPVVFQGGTTYPASSVQFDQVALGGTSVGLPQITNVQVLDFDGDGANEVLACDSLKNQVVLFRQVDGEWQEEVLVPDVAAPAHATAVDIDSDGDIDLVVSVLGNILPDDSVIGRVELFEATPDGYRRHVILDDVRRVADVQPADFDGDGDIDLAVAVFGYSRGSVLWLENRGELKFRDHLLHTAPGTIHVPIADYDGDGDLDIAAIVTQDEEELWGFENLGQGEFKKRRLWMTINHDLGSAGLVQADLDGDGDPDLILPAGDNLEDLDAYPQPYHGCYWFENQGDWTFQIHRISDLGGTYAADVGDFDSDGDLDVVLASMTNNWNRTDTASLVWLENDGQQNFTTWQIASDPIHLVTVAAGDLDGDGSDDIVAGALNLRKPFQRVSRVSAWINQGEGKQ
ncbi:FG-GAP repeat domain-containing protein [Rosistilla oblonga]|uniref:FG-GAP repeat domain-containing protein n=1 Tax=Rosistilla oblonga TaxID=2527990 RepID=UPI003A97D08E